MSEFGDLFGEFGVQHDGTPTRLRVRTYKGDGSMGPVFEPERVLEGLPVFSQNRLIRGPDGDERMSQHAVYAEAEYARVLALRSEVILPDGRVTTVLSHASPSIAGLFEFVAVNLDAGPPMTFDGADAVMAAVNRWRRNLHEGAADGLALAARNVLNVSNESVPHEEGDLERDGATAVDRKRLIAGVGYGRRADRRIVAIVQHEDMSLRHDPGRGPKFLERALLSERDKTMPIVRGAIVKRTRGEMMTDLIESFELDVLHGVAAAIRDNPDARVPVQWDPDPEAAYDPERPAVVIDLYPDRAGGSVSLVDYPVDDDSTLSDSVIGVQVTVRHPRRDVVKALAGDVFDLLHGRPAGMLGAVTVVAARRASGTNVGQNASGWMGRVDNYYLTVHRPSPHRT